MKIKRFLLLLVRCLFAAACTATAGFVPVVLAVGDTTITVQTSAKAGAKMTDIDSSGKFLGIICVLDSGIQD